MRPIWAICCRWPGVEYVTGAEVDRGYRRTARLARRRATGRDARVHVFVWRRILRRHGQHHPATRIGYEYFRDRQPYSLTLTGHDGETRRYFMFRGELPFWAYRRIFDGRMLNGSNGITLINWASNDYFGANLIDPPSPGAYSGRGAAAVVGLSLLAANRSPTRRRRPGIPGTEPPPGCDGYAPTA